MDKKLSKGLIVRVYHDPLDCNMLEGEAMLIRCINPMIGIYNKAKLSKWIVMFNDDYDNRVVRTINSKNCDISIRR